MITLLGTSQSTFSNEPLRNTRGTFFGKFQDVPMVFLFGTSWSHDLVHCECTEHFLSMRHIVGTFFGKFQDVPMNYLIRTSWSHSWEHYECTDHFLCQGNCREIGWENSDVLAVYQIRIVTMYQACSLLGLSGQHSERNKLVCLKYMC